MQQKQVQYHVYSEPGRVIVIEPKRLQWLVQHRRLGKESLRELHRPLLRYFSSKTWEPGDGLAGPKLWVHRVAACVSADWTTACV